MPSAPLSSDAQKKILAAYKKFHATVKQITREHQKVIRQLLEEVEQMKIAKLKKTLSKKNTSA